jgi:hypothetical protein
MAEATKQPGNQATVVQRATKQPSNQALVVFALAAVLAVACKDATGPKAQINNIETKPKVYAMNSAAITLPAALQLRLTTAVRIDASFQFDAAFDLDTNGVVQVYPVTRVSNELVGGHRVGFQMSGTNFNSTLKAPSGGYQYDSVFALPIGATMLVDVSVADCASSFLGVAIKAKMSVDSVNTTTRAIYLHVLSNPNCGFRSLVQGEPKD